MYNESIKIVLSAMSNKESLEDVKNGVVSEVIKAAKDNPNVKAAGSELGKTALILTKTVNNALLPLAAVNFDFEKARAYFAEKFQADLAIKAASLPPDQIVEPKASIAGPALQGLAFSHEEPNLKDMYLSLLTSAMDGRVAEKAHPAFVEIIRQLNSEEARLLREILRATSGLPIAEIRLTTTATGVWHLLLSHLLNLRNGATDLPVENLQLPAMVDNWVRLGLVDVDYAKKMAEGKSYDWVESRPEFLHFRTTQETDKQKVTAQRGVLMRTALGEQFAVIVGLLSQWVTTTNTN